MSETKTCLVCGKEFALVPGIKPRKFCSAKCAVRHHNAIAKAQRPTYSKRCVICGAEFETRQPNVYCCSPECSKTYKAEWQRRRREKGWTPKSPKSDAQKDMAFSIDHTYAAIKRKRRARPAVVDGWRGTPVMGGGSKALSLVPSA